MEKSALIRAEILRLTEKRGAEKTICPSEVVRNLYPQSWRLEMELVRMVAGELVREGKIEVLQRGQCVDPASAKGPIRLRWKG